MKSTPKKFAAVAFRIFILLSCIIAGVGSAQLPARAATLLDQSYLVSNLQSTFTSPGGFRVAETFTVGIAGTLSEIDVFLAFQGGLLTGMNILSTSGGVPTSTVLGTGTFQSIDASGKAVFTASLSVTVGEVLAIEPTANISFAGWSGHFPSTYAGGQQFVDAGSGFAATDFIGNSVASDFQTFVTTPSDTPLPTALPLFATGLGGLSWLGWRRKKKAAALAAWRSRGRPGATL